MNHNSTAIGTRFAVIVMMTASLVFTAISAYSAIAAEDERQLITLSPDIRDRFLEEMRHDLVNLAEVVSAIGDGDFEEAAQISERRMGLGHIRIQRMEESGASDEDINAAIKQIRTMAEEHGADLPNVMHQRGMGRGGVGRFMPEELRAIGQAFHKTAYPLANAARAVGTTPSVENFQALFSALSDMNNSCLGCHEAYRVK